MSKADERERAGLARKLEREKELEKNWRAKAKAKKRGSISEKDAWCKAEAHGKAIVRLAERIDKIDRIIARGKEVEKDRSQKAKAREALQKLVGKPAAGTRAALALSSVARERGKLASPFERMAAKARERVAPVTRIQQSPKFDEVGRRARELESEIQKILAKPKVSRADMDQASVFRSNINYLLELGLPRERYLEIGKLVSQISQRWGNQHEQRSAVLQARTEAMPDPIVQQIKRWTERMTAQDGRVYEIEKARKYFKVWRRDGSSRLIVAFVNPEGGIHKALGWKSCQPKPYTTIERAMAAFAAVPVAHVGTEHNVLPPPVVKGPPPAVKGQALETERARIDAAPMPTDRFALAKRAAWGLLTSDSPMTRASIDEARRAALECGIHALEVPEVKQAFETAEKRLLEEQAKPFAGELDELEKRARKIGEKETSKLTNSHLFQIQMILRDLRSLEEDGADPARIESIRRPITEADRRVREWGKGEPPKLSPKQTAKIARLEARAEKLRAEAAKRHEKIDETIASIPMGQPIIVGGRGEAHHRNAIAGMDRDMKAAIEATKGAEHLESVARHIENVAAVSSDDEAAIEKLEEKARTARTAAIRRYYEKRIERIRKEGAEPPWNPRPREGVTVSQEDGRIRLRFPQKPPADEIRALHHAGFVWSPSAKAWQRKPSNAARWEAARLLEKWHPLVGEAPPPAPAPVEPPPAPAPQKGRKPATMPISRTGIDPEEARREYARLQAARGSTPLLGPTETDEEKRIRREKFGFLTDDQVNTDDLDAMSAAVDIHRELDRAGLTTEPKLFLEPEPVRSTIERIGEGMDSHSDSCLEEVEAGKFEESDADIDQDGLAEELHEALHDAGKVKARKLTDEPPMVEKAIRGAIEAAAVPFQDHRLKADEERREKRTQMEREILDDLRAVLRRPGRQPRSDGGRNPPSPPCAREERKDRLRAVERARGARGRDRGGGQGSGFSRGKQARRDCQGSSHRPAGGTCSSARRSSRGVRDRGARRSARGGVGVRGPDRGARDCREGKAPFRLEEREPGTVSKGSPARADRGDGGRGPKVAQLPAHRIGREIVMKVSERRDEIEKLVAGGVPASNTEALSELYRAIIERRSAHLLGGMERSKAVPSPLPAPAPSPAKASTPKPRASSKSSKIQVGSHYMTEVSGRQVEVVVRGDSPERPGSQRRYRVQRVDDGKWLDKRRTSRALSPVSERRAAEVAEEDAFRKAREAHESEMQALEREAMAKIAAREAAEAEAARVERERAAAEAAKARQAADEAAREERERKALEATKTGEGREWAELLEPLADEIEKMIAAAPLDGWGFEALNGRVVREARQALASGLRLAIPWKDKALVRAENNPHTAALVARVKERFEDRLEKARLAKERDLAEIRTKRDSGTFHSREVIGPFKVETVVPVKLGKVAIACPTQVMADSRQEPQWDGTKWSTPKLDRETQVAVLGSNTLAFKGPKDSAIRVWQLLEDSFDTPADLMRAVNDPTKSAALARSIRAGGVASDDDRAILGIGWKTPKKLTKAEAKRLEKREAEEKRTREARENLDRAKAIWEEWHAKKPPFPPTLLAEIETLLGAIPRSGFNDSARRGLEMVRGYHLQHEIKEKDRAEEARVKAVKQAQRELSWALEPLWSEYAGNDGYGEKIERARRELERLAPLLPDDDVKRAKLTIEKEGVGRLERFHELEGRVRKLREAAENDMDLVDRHPERASEIEKEWNAKLYDPNGWVFGMRGSHDRLHGEVAKIVQDLKDKIVEVWFRESKH